MLVELEDKAVGVTTGDRLQDAVVRVDRGQALVRRVVVQRPVRCGRVPEQADDSEGMRLRRGLEHREVEPPVGRELGRDVTAIDGIDAIGRGLPNARERLVVKRGKRRSNRALLQDAAQFVDLAQVFDPQLSHEVAAPGQVGDLPFLLESPECLANGCDAQADLLGQVLLVEPLTRPELALRLRLDPIVELPGATGALVRLPAIR